MAQIIWVPQLQAIELKQRLPNELGRAGGEEGMMTLADEFTEIFRDEHRKIRDTLLDLLRAFPVRDMPRIRTLVRRVAVLTGPHFRYEEEALYPNLVEIFGPEYIDKLLSDRDRAIGNARKLVELAERDLLTDQEVSRALRCIRDILPHVSDCDGLSLMVERLSSQQVWAILDARNRCLDAKLDLLHWSQEVRGRAAVEPE